MPRHSKMRDINMIIRNEPKMDLESDPEWYQGDPEEDQVIEQEEEVSTDDTLVKLQAANSRIMVLEELWKMERWLNNQLETTLTKVEMERNVLQAQLDTIDEGCSASKKAPKNKRKMITEKTEEGNKSKEGKDKEKKVEPCKTCGKNHLGVCLKDKNICYNCKQEGHKATNCPNPRKGLCFNCRNPGHQAKTCPKKGKKAT